MHKTALHKTKSRALFQMAPGAKCVVRLLVFLLTLMAWLGGCETGRTGGRYASPAATPIHGLQGLQAARRTPAEANDQPSLWSKPESIHNDLVDIHAEDTVWIVTRSDETPHANSPTQPVGLFAQPIADSDNHTLQPEQTTPPRWQPMPLVKTDVVATIRSFIASVDVTQTYENPHTQPIEAVYRFPLPTDAAVDRFTMQIGDRTIHGLIKNKADAQALYAKAKAAGLNAALLNQDRPNQFEQRVANIQPGHPIDIRIRYGHTLRFDHHQLVFHFPMAIAQRFGDPLPNGEKQTNHQGVRLSVDIDLGMPIDAIQSPTHDLQASMHGQQTHLLAMQNSRDRLDADRDFVLRFEPRDLAGATTGSVLTHHDPKTDATYFAAMVCAPSNWQSLTPQPTEWVFLIDASGSMGGRPIEQSKQAITQALALLDANDRFQLVAFNDRVASLFETAMPATANHLGTAKDWLKQLQAKGGTQMLDGLQEAVSQPVAEGRRHVVCLLSDGLIGDENNVFEHVRRLAKNTHVFTIGLGDAPNRHLLEAVAEFGNGGHVPLAPSDDAHPPMAEVVQTLRHPALTDVTVGSPDGRWSMSLPDLWFGRPLCFTGRFQGGTDRNTDDTRDAAINPASTLVIRGRSGDQTIQWTLPTHTTDGGEMVATHWARKQIQHLMVSQQLQKLQANIDRDQQAIEALSHDFNVLSPYTSFLAVDASMPATGKRD